MGFFDDLQRLTSHEREFVASAPAIRAALAGTLPLASYLAFLTEAYHHVRHTVPLLMAVGSHLPERLGWLRAAVARYIAEEQGHEEWVLADLAAAGGDADAVRHGRPGLATELMVSYAWDTIERGNPVGFFGMVQVLEGTSVALASAAATTLQQALGLPATAFSYLTSHGALDQGHVEFFAGLMNRIEDDGDRAAVVHVARVIYRLYGEMFRALPLPDAAGTRSGVTSWT